MKKNYFLIHYYRNIYLLSSLFTYYFLTIFRNKRITQKRIPLEYALFKKVNMKFF